MKKYYISKAIGMKAKTAAKVTTVVLLTALTLQTNFANLSKVFKNRAERRLPNTINDGLRNKGLEKTTHGSRFRSIFDKAKLAFSATEASADEKKLPTPEEVSEWFKKKQIAGRFAPVSFDERWEVGFIEKSTLDELSRKHWDEIGFGREIRIFDITRGKREITFFSFDITNTLAHYGLRELSPHAKIVMTGGDDKQTTYAIADKGMDGIITILLEKNGTKASGTANCGPPFKLSEEFFLTGLDDAVLAIDLKQKKFMFLNGKAYSGDIQVEGKIDAVIPNKDAFGVMSGWGLVLFDAKRNLAFPASLDNFETEPKPTKIPLITGSGEPPTFVAGGIGWKELFIVRLDGDPKFEGTIPATKINILWK